MKQTSSVVKKLEEISERQQKLDRELHNVIEKQKENAVVCKNILHLLKKADKTNIDQYKVSSLEPIATLHFFLSFFFL